MAKTIIALALVGAIKATVKTQGRAEINPQALEDYKSIALAAKAKGADAPFDPAGVVFEDEQGNHWLADGFTRRQALIHASYTKANYEARKGSQQEAMLFAFKANLEHGARLTREDYLHNMHAFLAVTPDASNYAIGDAIGKDESWVRKNRPAVAETETRTTKKGKKVKTTGIGKKGGKTPKAPKEPKKTAAASSSPKKTGKSDGNAPEPAPEPSKKELELAGFIDKIAKSIGGEQGDSVKKALQDGSLPLTFGEVRAWSESSAARIKRIAPLVTGNRWSPAKAYGFIDREITGKTTVEDLILNAVISEDGWFANIAGFKITVEKIAKK